MYIEPNRPVFFCDLKHYIPLSNYLLAGSLSANSYVRLKCNSTYLRAGSIVIDGKKYRLNSRISAIMFKTGELEFSNSTLTKECGLLLRIKFLNACNDIRYIHSRYNYSINIRDVMEKSKRICSAMDFFCFDRNDLQTEVIICEQESVHL